jgi:cytochrome c oxidase cbb3-type subunit 4
MSYETIATFSQVTSLLMFITMFAVVVLYALWPSNQRRFDEAQRRALDLDPSTTRLERVDNTRGQP